MSKLQLYIVHLFLVNYAFSFDPSVKFKECIGRGDDKNDCTKQILEDFTSVLGTGVPELSMPPMDPMRVNHMEFNMFDATVEFDESSFSGFKNMIVESSRLDSDKKTWTVRIRLPKFAATTDYTLYGTLPPNLDLDRSSGPGRMNGNNIDGTMTMYLGTRSDGKIKVGSMDLSIDLNNMKVQMDCLFPKNGKCCPKKFLKSCNTILSKTVHKIVNGDSKAFVKKFQPEITRQIAPILEKYVNMALRNVDASDVI